MNESPDIQHGFQHDLASVNPLIILLCAAPRENDHVFAQCCALINELYRGNLRKAYFHNQSAKFFNDVVYQDWDFHLDNIEILFSTVLHFWDDFFQDIFLQEKTIYPILDLHLAKLEDCSEH